MKFTIPSEVLTRVLTQFTQIVSKKSTLEVLYRLSIEADVYGTVTFYATNLEEGQVITVKTANVLSPGTVLVSYADLHDACSRAKNEEITFAEVEQTLQIRYGARRFALQGWDTEEYPAIPPFNPTYTLPLIDRERYTTMMESVYRGAATDEGRPVFTGICFRIREGVLSLIAADQFRLFHYRYSDPQIVSCFDEPLVPQRAIKKMIKLLKEEKKSKQVLLSYDDEHQTFQAKVEHSDYILTFFTRTIDGAYPYDTANVIKNVVPDCIFTTTVAEMSAMCQDLHKTSATNANLLAASYNRGIFSFFTRKDGVDLAIDLTTARFEQIPTLDEQRKPRIFYIDIRYLEDVLASFKDQGFKEITCSFAHYKPWIFGPAGMTIEMARTDAEFHVVVMHMFPRNEPEHISLFKHVA